jgi:hypothetical protein
MARRLKAAIAPENSFFLTSPLIYANLDVTGYMNLFQA